MKGLINFITGSLTNTGLAMVFSFVSKFGYLKSPGYFMNALVIDNIFLSFLRTDKKEFRFKIH